MIGAATGATLGGKIGSIFGPIGKALGSVAGGVVGGIAGAFVGGTAGDVAGHLLANAIPGVCRGLTCLAKWSEVHPNCEIWGSHALMPDAKMNCLLGGVITIVQLNFSLAADYAFLSYFAYARNEPDANDDKPFEPYDTYLDEEEDDDLLKEIQSDELAGYTRLTDPSEVGLKEDDLINKKSGFFAQVYKDSNGKYVLVYRGTSNGHDKNREIIPGFSKDWIDDNAKQGVGLGSEQYEQAIKTAQTMKESVKKENMTITGHSLGGGLAQAAGAAVGCETYAYNPAGVHPNTFKEYEVSDPDFSRVHTIYAKIDFLNFFNNNSIIFPNTDGERILIDTKAPVNSLGDLLHMGHDLPYLIKALKKGAEAKSSSVVAEDTYGRAIDARDMEKVKYLLQCGADINKGDYNTYTPVLTAARTGNWDMVEFLIDNGADPMGSDEDGGTAQYWIQDAIDMSKGKLYPKIRSVVKRYEALGVKFTYTSEKK